jgi:predicted Zn-dependent peptidase
VIDTEVDARSLLRRVWHTGSGKVCSVPVGNDESAKLAHLLYKRLKRNGKSETIEKVIHSFTAMSPEDVLKLIFLLQQYNLVSVVEQREGGARGGEK